MKLWGAFRRMVFIGLVAFVGLTVPSARALIVFGSPAGSTSDPGNGLAWNNVGSVGGASGIYLGSFVTGFWVITANHVGAATATFGGTSYSAVAGSAQQIGSTDLLVFRIATDPLLPNLSLATTTPVFNTPVWMVGFGGGTKNWGTNNREGAGNAALGGSTTFSISTDYDLVSGEAQGTGGDSGGALFFQSSGTWYLGGVMSSITTISGVSYTISSDIATYRGQIGTFTGTAIPEPATVGLIFGLAVLGLAVWRRRRG